MTFRWKYCCCIWNNLHIPLLNGMFEVCTGVKKLKTSYHTCLSVCIHKTDGWISTPSPSNVICDLLFYNKLPYHVILAGRSNHACKKQSNYSPLLSQKRSSIPMSSLYTMQQHKSIVYVLPEILDFWLQVAMKSHLHDFLHGFLLVTNAFLSCTVSCKALPEEEWMPTFWLWVNMSI